MTRCSLDIPLAPGTTSSLDYAGNNALELNGGTMTFITGTSPAEPYRSWKRKFIKRNLCTPSMNIKVDGIAQRLHKSPQHFPMGLIATQMTQL